MDEKLEKWQVWILDALAPGGGYIEDACDDIVAQGLASPREINDYLIALGEEPVYKE